jgi:hypothetical protein
MIPGREKVRGHGFELLVLGNKSKVLSYEKEIKRQTENGFKTAPDTIKKSGAVS